MTTPDEPTARFPPPGQQPAGNPPPARQRATRTFRNLTRSTPAPPPPNPAKRSLRRRKPRITPPTQTELDALPVEKRQELHDARQQRPWQHLTSLGVLLGLLFAAGGLVYTAKSWDTSQKTLDSSVQGQITDRYAKGVEQLGSETIEVRLGSIYALQRLSIDSPRDALTIENVLAAFVRNRDFCQKEPRLCVPDAKLVGTSLDTDVQAALDVAVALSGVTKRPTNLSAVRLPGVLLFGADLTGADLTDANLTGANLYKTDLTHVDLNDATLTRADLTGANLTAAIMTRTELTDAGLSEANLTGADLKDAKLKDAILVRANLTGANLTGADFAGADLREIRGVTPDQVRRFAVTDSETKF